MEVLFYLIYALCLITVIGIFNWVHLKLETLRLKHRFIKDLVEKGYETDKIDLNKFFK